MSRSPGEVRTSPHRGLGWSWFCTALARPQLILSLGTRLIWAVAVGEPVVGTSPANAAPTPPPGPESSLSPSLRSDGLAARTNQALLTAVLKKEALDAAKQVVEAYPDEPLAHVLVGSSYYNIGQSEAATPHLKRCLVLKPEQPEAYDILAKMAYERGELEECVRLSKEALRHGSPTSEVLNRLGRAELDLGLVREAIRTLEQASGQADAPSESHYLLGQAHLQAGAFAQARSQFEKTIKLVPDHTQAYFGLFTVCQRLGRSEDAARFRQEFLRLEEVDRRAHTDRSAQADTLSGLPMVRETVARTLFGAAQIHGAHGESGKAAELLRRCASLDAESSMYRAALETLFLQRKAITDGLAAFQEMSREQPESSLNHLFAGRFQARVQDYDSAERSYRKVIELAPQRPEGHRALADLLLRANTRLDEATALARRTVELEPSGSNYHLLALVYLKNNARVRALEAARQAVARSPNDLKYQQLLEKLEKASAAGSPR